MLVIASWKAIVTVAFFCAQAIRPPATASAAVPAPPDEAQILGGGIERADRIGGSGQVAMVARRGGRGVGRGRHGQADGDDGQSRQQGGEGRERAKTVLGQVLMSAGSPHSRWG